MRYFEVDMSNHDHSDTYSMCIKATHFPTKGEVKTFLRKDMKTLGTRKLIESLKQLWKKPEIPITWKMRRIFQY